MTADMMGHHETPRYPDSGKGKPFYRRVSWAIEKFCNKHFDILGRWVGSNPGLTLLLSTGLSCLAFVGFLNFSVESGRDVLWTPSGSDSDIYRSIVEANFGKGSASAQLLYTADPGGNVLSKFNVDQMWGNYLTLTRDSDFETSYDDVCIKTPENICVTTGLLAFWGGSYDTYLSQVVDDISLLHAVSAASFPNGAPVNRDQFLGKVVEDVDGNVLGAEGYSSGFLLDGENPDSLLWLAMVQDVMAIEAPKLEGHNAFYFTSRSIDDELEAAVNGEIYLSVLVFVLMIVCVTALLGPCDKIKSRKVLGATGVALIFFAGATSYGFCSALGVPFTSLVQVLPFLVMGIGVDDMFIIVETFDDTDPMHPVHVRLGTALSRCGMTITYTTLTDVFAFILGTLTSLPAVRYFCIYAAFWILFDFMLQCTAFCAVLTYDARRQNNGAWDVLCCIKRGAAPPVYSRNSLDRSVNKVEKVPVTSPLPGNSPVRPPSARDQWRDSASPRVRTHKYSDSYGSQLTDTSDVSALDPTVALDVSEHSGAPSAAGTPTNRAPSPKKWRRKRKKFAKPPTKQNPRLISRFFGEWYGPFLMQSSTKALVIAMASVLFGMSVWGVQQVVVEFDVSTLTPSTSYTNAYINAARPLGLLDDFVPVALYFEDVDYTSPAVQAEIDRLELSAVSQPYTTGPIDSWIGTFREWAQTVPDYAPGLDSDGYFVDESLFLPAVNAFLSEPANIRFKANVVFDEPDSGIAVSRVSIFHFQTSTVNKMIDAMQDLRQLTAASSIIPRPFAYSTQHLFTEQFLVLYREILSNFLLMLVVLFCLSILVLGSVRHTCLAVLFISCVNMELLASIYFWGLSLNAITGIQMIIAIGLVVDYMVHVLHYFQHQDNTLHPEQRVINSLQEIGPSVLMGAGTTFAGILPMSLADNEVFQIFFRMLFSTVILGVFHGLVVLPVVLTLLPQQKKTQKGVWDSISQDEFDDLYDEVGELGDVIYSMDRKMDLMMTMLGGKPGAVARANRRASTGSNNSLLMGVLTEGKGGAYRPQSNGSGSPVRRGSLSPSRRDARRASTGGPHEGMSDSRRGSGSSSGSTPMRERRQRERSPRREARRGSSGSGSASVGRSYHSHAQGRREENKVWHGQHMAWLCFAWASFSASCWFTSFC
ncbi:unnamed protein product [Chrysoparadoxa australica]